MSTINLTESEYYGRTSRPAAGLERPHTECLGCGSSLAGRLEGVQTWGGRRVRAYLCGCGRRRRVEVAA